MDVYSPAPLFEGPTPTKVTTLANGLKVASSDLATPCTTVGVYVDTGSSCEQVAGTSHIMQHMAFKSSASCSHFRLVRECETLGATPMAIASRENMVYQVDTLKDSVPAAVEMLASTLFEPKFMPWEVEEQKGVVKLELEDLAKNHQALVQELMHTAAYGSQSALGKPLMCPPRNLGAISPDVLGAFAAEQLVPSKMVLAAAGYDHAELVALAEATFGKVPAGPNLVAAASPYVGGEYRESSDEDLTHFALCFEGAGWKDKALVPLCVLNTLMGGGASFSAGGPGKGMYTRLYSNILNKAGYVQAASGIAAFYNGTGMFGVYGATAAPYMGELVGMLCAELKKMAGTIGAEELARAKNQLKSSLLMNLEQRAVLFEDIGRQVLTYGARTPPEELVAQIDAVTAADVTGVAAKLLKTPPSIVVYGDTTSVPRYDVIAKQFA